MPSEPRYQSELRPSVAEYVECILGGGLPNFSPTLWPEVKAALGPEGLQIMRESYANLRHES
jgi:hypothetical protein